MLTLSLTASLHETECIEIGKGHLFIRMLVDLWIGLLSDKLFRPHIHCTFHTGVRNIRNDRLCD